MTEPALRLESVSAWYGEARALTDVSLDVAAGEVVTLVGRNGAGKTTLLRSTMGLHRQCEGRVRVDGADVSSRSADARARSSNPSQSARASFLSSRPSKSPLS